MNDKNIFDALRDIDVQWILDAAPQKRTRNAHTWVKWGALAACLCLVIAAILGAVLWPRPDDPIVTEPTLPHEHIFGEWQTAKDATCAAQGEEIRLCACGETETRYTELLPHFAGEWVVEKEPTIKLPTPEDPDEREPGIKSQFCENCGAKLGEELIPAMGSLGLAYAINPDGKTFSVAGIGNCTDADIIVPENFCGYHVTSVMDGALRGCDTVRSITLPDTVTLIGNRAFQSCEKLESILFSQSLSQIGEYAFAYCRNLKTVDIPQGVTDIGKNAFSSCYELKSIILPDGLKHVPDNLLGGCINLEAVFCPDSLESIGNAAFESCSSLQSLILPSGITRIGKNAFRDCRQLINLVLPDSLQAIEEYALSYCYSLEYITIPQSVTRIEHHAFIESSALKEIEIPENVTEIGAHAFLHCYGLQKVTLPKGLKTIENSAFYGCSALGEINIPDSVTWIGADAFSHCDALVQIENEVGYVGNWAVSLPADPLEFTVREGTVGIAGSAFYTYGDFVEVTLPSSLKYINKYAFAGCWSLERIIFCGTEEQWNAIEKASDWADGSNSFEILFIGTSNE